MDKLEKWYKDHRNEMDQLELRPELWQELSQKLHQPPSPSWWRFKGWQLSIAAFLLMSIGFGSYFFFGEKHMLTETAEQKLPADIQLMTPQGEKIALSSLKGKVVLLEFWASWCNHCREYNCNDLLPIYDEYKDQGFEIYAVSLDHDSTEWILGIQRDQLPGVHVSDLQGYASPVSQMYSIQRTPTTFLIDENMNIIGKNLTRDEMEKKLYECYYEEN